MKRYNRWLALLCAGSLLLLASCGASDYTGTAEVLSGNEKPAQEEEVYTPKAFVDPEQTDKAEIVYVSADALGAPEKTEVSVTLKNPGGLDPITDQTNLTNIRNTGGNEDFTLENGFLTWENHGEDITYKGVSDAPLPVSVKATYYLDGNEIAPSELAGKSGHVKLRFDYTNLTDYVPFVCVTLVMFDGEAFRNITGDGVRLLRYGDSVVAFGLTVPGLEQNLNLSGLQTLGEQLGEIRFSDAVEIEADTAAFALDYTETVAFNGLLSELSDEDLQDLTDTAEDLGESTGASDKLKEGIDRLVDGLAGFQEGLNAYTRGVDQCADGARQIKNGMQAFKNLGDLLPGKLGDTFSGLYDAVAGLSEGLDQLSANSQSLRDGAQSILAGSSALSEGVATLNAEALVKMAQTGADVKTLIATVKTLRTADGAYRNFSGIAPEKTGSVLFMIETAGVKTES